MRTDARILRRLLSGLLIVSWPLPPLALAQAPAVPPVPPSAGRLEGRILRSDGKTPVPGAVVRVCYLEGGTTFASAATSPRGEYEISGLSHGYADLSVETPEGAFLASQVVNLLDRKSVV